MPEGRHPPTDSASDLVGDLLDHATGLVRKELDLLRAELREETEKAALALGMLAGAAVVAVAALNVLAAAAVAWLAEAGLGPGWAALVVGVVLALVAVALMTKGRRDLTLSRLAPTRTARNMERDVDAVKEAAGHG